MAIADDWEVDFINKVISHKDGVLDFDGVTTGDPPQHGDYIRGATTGAVGRILGSVGLDITNAASGTITLTNVVGRFQDNESLEVLDKLDFDGVTNGGFQTGDTLETSTGASITVDALEYHYTEATTSGSGSIYGRASSTAFADNDTLRKSTASSTTVANVNGTLTAGDAWTGALVNEPSTGTITPPTSDRSVIINFDSGTEAIPRFCSIQNTDDASPTKTAIVQKVYGVTATGSLRLVDTATAWADNDPIYVKKIPYDGLLGTTFKVGDKIVTKSTAGAPVNGTGKVIVVETTTASTGKLTLQNQSGTFNDNDYIYVRTTSDTSYATINAPTAADFQDLVAYVTGAEITEQLQSQGGIYNGDSLNIVRDSNALYTFLQDTFDELGALDDKVPMTAQVALQQFTLVNGWKIPDLSFRFLESGSIQDSALDNIWTNFQTIGSVEGIGNEAYGAVTPLPQFYIAQGTTVIDTFWLTGHIDVLVKVKTNTRPDLTSSSTGVLINNGTVTIFNRNFGDTYDHFETTTIAGVAPIPLATASDLNNTSGTHSLDFDGQSSTDFVEGEEIRSTVNKRGIITSVTDAGTTGTIKYVLVTSTNFADNDAITGQYSGSTANVTQAPTNVVAGYQTQIVVASVKGTIAGTVTSTTSFIDGETVTQTNTNAQGIMMDFSSSTMTLGNVTESTDFNSTDTITGDTSSTSFTPSGAFTTATAIQRDIKDGAGSKDYNAVIYLDRDGDGSGDTLSRMYEWVKYRTRSLETQGEPPYNLLGGVGSDSGVPGRLYTSLNSSYALVKASPLGTFAGGKFFGARGIFIQDMAAADIRNYQLIDASGTVRNPPNLQTLSVTGLVAGDRVAVFRTTGGNIQTAEFQVSSTINSTVNGNAASIIEVSSNQRSAGPLPQDVPDSAVIRVLDPAGSGLYFSYTYTSVDRTNSQFTLSGTIGRTLVAGDNAFVVLIEEEAASTSVSNNIVYVSDIPILTRVRRKGILPFEVSGTFGSSGATVAAIRTFDSIVD